MKKKLKILFPHGDKIKLDLRRMKLTLILMFFVGVSFGNSSSNDKISSLFNNNEKTVSAIVVQQQQKQISGKIMDSSRAPLPGVTVIVKGTTIGTVSDINGHFVLTNIKPDNVLVFSFIGMKSQEIKISNKTKINVVLQENTIGLEEVVAVGYGIQKKESVVGAIAHTTSKELERTGNVPDLTTALAGQLPGLVSITSSGEPGGLADGSSATNIYIRGQNTWNGGQPLVMVDGSERSMDNIDINEVESISVLKDASATAVFGVKGANGVILITTKRGTSGKTKLSFNYTLTMKSLSKQPEKLNSYDTFIRKNEMIEREGVLNEPSWDDYVPYDIVTRFRSPQTEEYAAIYPDVDWVDEMYKDMSLSHRANLSASGGNDVVKFFGSFAYLHEGDMFEDYSNGKGYSPNYNYDRMNFRSNIDVKLTNTTKIGVNFSGYYGKKNTNYNNEGSTSRADQWMWAAAYTIPSDMMFPMMADGRWGCYQEGGNNSTNPLAAAYNLGIRTTRTTQLNSDFNIEQDLKFITKGLKAKGSFFYDNTIRSEGGIYDIQNSVRPAESRTNVAFEQIYWNLYEGTEQDPSEYTALLPVNDEEYDWILQPWTTRSESISAANWSSYIPVTRRKMYQLQMNYARDFNKHSVTAMGAFKREEYARGSMFKNYREDWVFRTTYNYDSRYLIEANGAYNGSEQFGPGYRFAFFPSAALGWYLSNEKFFNVPAIDRLKLRFSVGKVGDDNVSGSRWLYASQLAYGGYARLGESTSAKSPYTFYRESVVGNPDIQWESAVKTNYGLDFGMFKNLITLTVDYFREDRKDILLSGSSRNVPVFFGATAPSANLGHVKSKGYEIELGFDKRLAGDMRLWANMSITHNENKIIFKDDAELKYDYQKAAGYSIGQSRSIIATDFYNNWDDIYASVPTENNDLDKLPGYYNLIDFDGDGVIKSSSDSAPVGYSGIPQNTANLSVGFDYKGFSMMVQFYGVNNASRNISFNNYTNNFDVVYGHAKDYWSADNTDASSFLPRWKTSAENVGDHFLYDASYIRLRTAEIAYTFNKDPWFKKLGLDNLKVFINGNNLFFWSNLPDDRESTYSGGGGSATQGAYPTTKRINLGFDLTF